MYWLSFDLNFLITSLVSSNSSYPSRASELKPGFCGVHGAWSLVFCVVFCRSLFLGFLSIVLSVLRFMDSDNPLGIFKLFLPFKSIWAQPGFCGVHGAWSLSFLCSILQIIVLVCFFPIVLSVLRFTDSDYHFGIFKLFLSLLKPLKF